MIIENKKQLEEMLEDVIGSTVKKISIKEIIDAFNKALKYWEFKKEDK